MPGGLNWETKYDDSMKDAIDSLFNTTNEPIVDNTEEELDSPTLILNLNDIDSTSTSEALEITQRLSNYYFDEKYLINHPYIKNKINQEVNNIRRLLKMLAVNEAAQDALITNITSNAGKGSLYQSLTALQNTTLSIQTQLNKLVSELEEIFSDMQENCEQTFEQKEKELDQDGKFVVRGSRDFIHTLMEQGISQRTKYKEPQEPEQLQLFDNNIEDIE